MASRTGACLDPIGRDSLIRELRAKGELPPEPNAQQNEQQTQTTKPKREQGQLPMIGGVLPEDFDPGTGCLVCGDDDNHANLLLCESCNDEYHTYCLSPPLAAVPSGDWYCDKCKDRVDVAFQDDGLDELVCALSPTFTSRFGEICWAQGGVGFGWWPSFIYDPRFTVGNARQLARKNLGRRHLTYFFECHDAPFAVLTGSKITKWEDGILEDYHLGKTARSQGRARFQLFQQAFQAATVELGKPIEMRLDWNHAEQPQILPPPGTDETNKRPVRRKRTKDGTDPAPASPANAGAKKRRRGSNDKGNGAPKVNKASKSVNKRRRGFAFLTESPVPNQVASRASLIKALEEATRPPPSETATPIELLEDGALYCKLLQRIDNDGIDAIDSGGKPPNLFNVGFVKLDSRRHGTFADARSMIESELVPDCLSPTRNWRFLVPGLGPVSSKQEASLGPMLPLLQHSMSTHLEGKGTLHNPVHLIIVDQKPTPRLS